MKKFGLLQKILIIILLPLLIILILTGMTMFDIGEIVAERVEKTNLDTANYTVQSVINALDEGEYVYLDNQLYKGDINISEFNESLDELKASTNVDVTILYNDTRIATTIKGSDGNRLVGTTISNDVFKNVSTQKEVFDDTLTINGSLYYGYYEVVAQTADGNYVIVFTGVDQKSISDIYVKRINSTMIFFSLLIGGFAIGIGFFIRKIVKNILTSIGYLNQVTEGKLNISVDKKILDRKDEVGSMAHSIEKLVIGLSNIVNSLSDNSDTLVDFSKYLEENFQNIQDSVQDVNSAVEEIAKGASIQAKDANDVNDEIEEMGRAVDKATSGIETLNDIKKDMENSNNEVSMTLKDLGEISERTQKVIHQVYDQTQETNDAAQKINGVIDMIQEIASQTSLLSLNASIEAARAGEQGKGFAVVADEVRKLAEQSESSAQQISDIVLALIAKTNEGVSSMENVMKENKLQEEKLAITQEAFTELNKEIQKVATEVENINVEIKNIDNSKNNVLDQINRLATVSTQSAASTEETSASMERVEAVVTTSTEKISKLNQICDSLNNNVNKFELSK